MYGRLSNQSKAFKHSLLEIMFVNFQLPARPRVYDVSDKASKESLEKLRKPKHQVSPFSSQSNESILNAYWTAPEKSLVVGAGFDPSGYFLDGQSFFRRATNQEIFGFFIFIVWIFATLWLKSMVHCSCC